jgi:outer membrane protein assembly factor BamB
VWAETSGTIWTVVAGTCGIATYQAVTDGAGATRLQLAWQTGTRATTPVLAGGVLFAATSRAVLALDPHTGQQLWSSAQEHAGGTIGGVHWESPIVIDGKLYISDEDGAIAAYGL